MEEFMSESLETVCLPLTFNPWAALTGETQPTIEFLKRGRGRPRKHNLPTFTYKREHKIGDSEVEQVTLSLLETKQMVEFFKIQRDLRSLTDALNVTAEKFEITYIKAHHDLGNYF